MDNIEIYIWIGNVIFFFIENLRDLYKKKLIYMMVGISIVYY